MKSFLKRYHGNKIVVLLLIALTASCIDPFNPDTTTTDFNYLVVDGFYNSTDTTFIRLSRTQSLQSATDSVTESGAVVTIEEDGGGSHVLTQRAGGVYFLAPGAVNLNSHVRLLISTSDGQQYQSPYVPIKVAPPIDSVSWKLTTNDGDPGVGIYINSHDPAGTTRYYFWEFVETWEYASKFRSDYVRIGDTIVLRDRSDDISHCWKTFPSNRILVSSTTALAEDRVNEFPLTFVNKFSPKLSYRYSLLVHQYALTADAYQYWTTLQKNTENLGTVFGPLPSQLTGNLVCTTNADNKVLGYFSASGGSTTRFNLYSTDLDPVNGYDDGYQGCFGTDIFVPLEDALKPTTNLFLYARYDGITLIGYQQASVDCTDCRRKGGTIKKPEWW